MRDDFDEGAWNYDYIRLAWDSGFCFTNQKTDSLVNLSSLCLVDIERTITERDVSNVEKHLNTIVNYTLEEQHARILDGTFVKVFKMSQLAVQYLQFCKKYLDNTVTLLKKEIHELREENKNLNEESTNQRQDILELKRKLKPLSDVHQALSEKTYRCNQCLKVFSTEDFLLGHIKRRHENPPLVQTESDKLQLEIKELKERLNSTEKYIVHQDQPPAARSEPNNEAKAAEKHFLEVQSEVGRLKLQLESQTRIVEEQKSYQEKYEKWMEMAFQKFETKQMEIIDRNLTLGPRKSRESWTQTNVGAQKEGDQDLCTPSSKTSVVKNDELAQIKAEFVKMQDEMELDARNRFQKLEGFLEEKVTDKFEKFAQQMETIWQRIEGAQKTATPTHRIQSNESRIVVKPSTPSPVKDSQPPPKPQPQPQPRKQAALPLKSSTNKGVNIKETAPKHAFPEVTVLAPTGPKKFSDSSSASDSDNTSNFEIITSKKPSGASTIGQRSITSLKLVAYEDGVTSGLSKEIEELLWKRLENMGISPDWTGLPQESYEKAMRIVNHQANMCRKKMLNFNKIKKEISKKVEATAAKTSSSHKNSERSSKMARTSTMYESSDENSATINVIYMKPEEENASLVSATTKDSTNRDYGGAGDETIKYVKAKSAKKTFSNSSRSHRAFEESKKTDDSEESSKDAGDRLRNSEKAQKLTEEPRKSREEVEETPDNVTASRKSSLDFGAKSMKSPDPTPRSAEQLKPAMEKHKDSPGKVKKKVLFDLESLSKNSSDSEKLEAKEKQDHGEARKTYEKPVYIDELKTIFRSKSKELDITTESISYDEKLAEIKDPYASDFDISEILN